MDIFKENDVVRLKVSIIAQVLGENKKNIEVPSGSIGTIVLVHGDELKPAAYEVELFLEGEDSYALTTISAELVERCQSL